MKKQILLSQLSQQQWIFYDFLWFLCYNLSSDFRYIYIYVCIHIILVGRCHDEFCWESSGWVISGEIFSCESGGESKGGVDTVDGAVFPVKSPVDMGESTIRYRVEYVSCISWWVYRISEASTVFGGGFFFWINISTHPFFSFFLHARWSTLGRRWWDLMRRWQKSPPVKSRIFLCQRWIFTYRGILSPRFFFGILRKTLGGCHEICDLSIQPRWPEFQGGHFSRGNPGEQGETMQGRCVCV